MMKSWYANVYIPHARADFDIYFLDYALPESGETTQFRKVASRPLASAFDDMIVALYGSGNTIPLPFDAPKVGFTRVSEMYCKGHSGDKHYLVARIMDVYISKSNS